MPYEIHSSVPIHPPKPTLLPLKSIEPYSRGDNLRMEPPPDKTQPKYFLKYQFQHDLESLWWVALWVVLYRVGGAKAAELTKNIFVYSRTPTQTRIAFFLTRTPSLGDYINDQLQCLTSYFLKIQDILLAYDATTIASNDYTALADHVASVYVAVWAPLSYLVHLACNNATLMNLSFQDPEPEPLDLVSKPEVEKKKIGKRKAREANDDHDFRANRQGTRQGKAPSSGNRAGRLKRKD